MKEYTIKCAECGSEFVTDKHNRKYCDYCKKIVEARKRKEWIKRTGYNEKQRKYQADKRATERAEHSRISAEQMAHNRADASDRVEQAKAEIKRRASEGDPLANLQLATIESGNTSVKFWHWFKAYELSAEHFKPYDRTRTVNDINILDEDFEQKVVDSLGKYRRIVLGYSE